MFSAMEYVDAWIISKMFSFNLLAWWRYQTSTNTSQCNSPDNSRKASPRLFSINNTTSNLVSSRVVNTKPHTFRLPLALSTRASPRLVNSSKSTARPCLRLLQSNNFILMYNPCRSVGQVGWSVHNSPFLTTFIMAKSNLLLVQE